MGEAKYRKMIDPNYGKPSPATRGIILSVPIVIEGVQAHVRKSDLDEQDLRSTLLYWDRIALPISNIIYMPGGVNVDYLESCGVLDRIPYFFEGDGVQSLIEAQYRALADLERKQPGCWSLGAGDNSLFVKHEVATLEKGSLLTLYNALPVPKENTPLQEILEFKQKRHTELLLLRSHLDSLTAEIASKNDSVDELNKKMAELNVACSDLIRTTKEYQLPVYLANMNASLNFEATKVAGTAIAVWASTTTLGLGTIGAAAASFASAAATTFNLKADIKFRSLKRPSSPYRYAYFVQRDLT